MRKITLVVFFLLLPLWAMAQGTAPAWGQKHEKINTLILMRLTQELGLNASQSAQLGQVLRKYQDQRHALKRQLRESTANLRAATATGNEAEIKKLLSQRSQTKADLDKIDDQMFSEVRPMLTPKQQAQFLIVMDEIKSEIRAIRQRDGTSGFPGATTTDPNVFPGAGNPNDPNAVNRAIQP